MMMQQIYPPRFGGSLHNSSGSGSGHQETGGSNGSKNSKEENKNDGIKMTIR
jgi:hypothetical protein